MVSVPPRRNPRLREAKPYNLRTQAQVCLKLSFTRFHHTSLLSVHCSQFSKTSAKSLSIFFFFFLLFLLAFDYSGDVLQKDIHLHKILVTVKPGVAKGDPVWWEDQQQGFLWLCTVLFLSAWRILFIRVCLQNLSVNIFSLLIFNPPTLSSFPLFQSHSPTCFLIH